MAKKNVSAPANGNGKGGKPSSERLIGRFTEKTLLKRAKEVVQEKSKASDIFDEEAESLLPRFKKSGACNIIVCKLCVRFPKQATSSTIHISYMHS